jgi:hypothetical protein
MAQVKSLWQLAINGKVPTAAVQPGEPAPPRPIWSLILAVKKKIQDNGKEITVTSAFGRGYR